MALNLAYGTLFIYRYSTVLSGLEWFHPEGETALPVFLSLNEKVTDSLPSRSERRALPWVFGGGIFYRVRRCRRHSPLAGTVAPRGPAVGVIPFHSLWNSPDPVTSNSGWWGLECMPPRGGNESFCLFQHGMRQVTDSLPDRPEVDPCHR